MRGRVSGHVRASTTYLVVLLAVFGSLRVVHLGVSALSPLGEPGPYFLAGLEGADEHLAFDAWIPVYHPEELGDEPSILVPERSPSTTVILAWREERFLVLEETLGEASLEVPATAAEIPGHPLTYRWDRGGVRYVLTRRGKLAIALRTDLGEEDVIRIVSTLVPRRP